MHTRPIDVTDTDEFRRWYVIGREAELDQRPEAPYWSERELQVMFSSRDAAEELVAYGTFDGDKMLAAGMTSFTLLDNVDKAFLLVDVEPALRRRGIGSAMLRDLVATSVAAGRGVILGEAWVPPGTRDDHPYRRFAESHGFALANVEVRRVLRLPIPAAQLAAWAAEAAEHHQDYRIETFVDDIPGELLESFCEVKNQLLLDAPTGDIELEAEEMTPDVVLERQATVKRQGRTSLHTLAISKSGDTVAYTTLAVPEDEPHFIHQWGTLVQRDHRGHRLGMAVKVANLVAAKAAFPDRTLVNTQNAETNGPMVSINERLGFRPVDELVEFQKIVSQ